MITEISQSEVNSNLEVTVETITDDSDVARSAPVAIATRPPGHTPTKDLSCCNNELYVSSNF